jgi:hypothetical protein
MIFMIQGTFRIIFLALLAAPIPHIFEKFLKMRESYQCLSVSR